jgi:hypothetical protein
VRGRDKVRGRGRKSERERGRGRKMEGIREIDKRQNYLFIKRTTVSQPEKNTVFHKANRGEDIDKSNCVLFHYV